MKNMKKLLACAATVMMIGAMSIPAVAASDTYDITIIPNSEDKASHTYEAYQIFTGDLADDTLSNIIWGSGIDDEATVGSKTVLDALKDIDDVFASCKDAASVADAIASPELTADDIRDVAKVLGKYLTDTHTDSVKTGSDIEISDLAAGYYLIKDSDDALDNGQSAYTNYILKVVKDVNVTVKSVIPSLDKEIDDGSGDPQKFGTFSIGDSIPFKLTSAVPNMAGYNEYYFIMHDKMTDGMSFNEKDLKVYFTNDKGEVVKELIADTDYFVTVDGQNIEIVFHDFIQYNTEDYIGCNVIATYTARLNENATVGGEGSNMNSASLTFSNDPNFTYGDNDKPTDPTDPTNPGGTGTEPTGKTPDSTTYVYTTGIKLVKVDAATQKRLNGAEFTITGDGVKDTVQITYSYEKDETGTFYKLKDGSFTEEVPTAETEKKYDSITDLYKLKQNVTVKGEDGYVSGVGKVGEDGVISFEGLNKGKYTITETKTPFGYNTIDPFEIEIEAEASETGCTWTASIEDPETGLKSDIPLDDDELFNIIVKNSKGTILPSTGGIGTKLFYIIGSILVIGAVVLFITQKRVNSKEK